MATASYLRGKLLEPQRKKYREEGRAEMAVQWRNGTDGVSMPWKTGRSPTSLPQVRSSHLRTLSRWHGETSALPGGESRPPQGV